MSERAPHRKPSVPADGATPFFAALEAARIAAGLTVDDLARAAGVDRAAYFKWRRGSWPRLDTATRLAAAVGRPLADLLQ